jgi:predicted transcriptional regulator
MAAATPKSLKQYLHTLADDLPDSATTDEALYHLVFRREIEAGLADSDAGRTVPMEAVMRRYGLNVRALTSAIGLRCE